MGNAWPGSKDYLPYTDTVKCFLLMSGGKQHV